MEEQPDEIEVGFEMNKILIVCLCPKEITKSQGRVGKGFVVGYSRTSTKDKNREGEEKNWEGKWSARRREDDDNGKERRKDGEEDPNNCFLFF